MNSTVLLTSVDIKIPGYRILRPIGEGGMASVFLAVQESLDREVALKVMSPALAANSEFASRFLIEGKITAKLQHPNLVTVYDIGTHAGVYYLAAEYIPGGTLKERIQVGGLSVAEILDITADIAAGLDFAHQKGFVHRDVKPGNVLFRNDGRVVLADFGIAKAMDGSNSSTVAGMSVGTPDYMSPEQARGETVDGRSDLYSLGTVLYEMLVGHAPYQASDPFTVALMHVTHPVPELPQEFAWLQPLLNMMMAKNPAERCNTGAALVDAIHKIAAGAPESAALHTSSGRKAGGSTRIAGSSATQQRTRVSVAATGKGATWVKPAAIGGTVLLALALGWKFYPRSPSSDAGVPPAAAADGDASAAPPAADGNADGKVALSTSFPAPAPAISLTADEVETELVQAETYLKTGTTSNPGDHLIYPDEDSALSHFRRVLAAQPENARAKAGIAGIVNFYRKSSYRLCEKGLWVQCGTIARVGLGVDPADPVLIELNAAADAGGRGETPKLPAPPTE